MRLDELIKVLKKQGKSSDFLEFGYDSMDRYSPEVVIEGSKNWELSVEREYHGARRSYLTFFLPGPEKCRWHVAEELVDRDHCAVCLRNLRSWSLTKTFDRGTVGQEV